MTPEIDTDAALAGRLRDAAERPDNWDVPGLLRDAAGRLEMLSSHAGPKPGDIFIVCEQCLGSRRWPETGLLAEMCHACNGSGITRPDGEPFT